MTMPVTSQIAEPTVKCSPVLRPGRWRQFSLRTLLLFTLAASVLSSWIAYKRNEAAQQQAAYRLIKAKGGASNFGPESARPVWLRWILGADVAAAGGCIEFYRPELTDADVATLTSLHNLQRLSLDRNPVTDRGIAHLARLPRLQFLSLEATQITDAGLESLRRCKSLQMLTLTNTQTTDAGVRQLQSALPELEIYDANEKEWPALKPVSAAAP
jgi:hypothetical protein